MDWAEDFKLSIKKTTARKGRRSSQQKTPSTPETPEKEISLDINVDDTLNSPDSGSGHRPRPPRRSGGWAESASKLGRSKSKNLIEEERFRLPTKSTSPPNDDIPVIPDLDDVKDEIMMNEIVEPPSVSVNRVVTLKELNSDLLSQNAFTAIEDVDLSILTKGLQAQETLDEADEVWEWEKLFTEVTAEIHLDKSIEVKFEIAADEILPAPT